MRAEHGQRAHVFLRVMELVEAPQRLDAMVGEMGEPVATVHRHEDRRGRGPMRHKPLFGRTIHGRFVRAISENERRERGHQWRDEHHVEDREDEIVAMTSGDQRSPLRRPHPLGDEEHADGRKADRADQDDPKVRDLEAKRAPPNRLDQPMATRATATAAIDSAGRYTRDESGRRCVTDCGVTTSG